MDVKTLFPSFCQCFPRWLGRRCWRFSEGLGSACCYFLRVGWASENVTWLAEPARAGSRWVLSPTHRDCDGISRSLAALPAAWARAHTLAPWLGQVQPYHQQLETQNCLFYNFHIPCLFWYLAFKYCQWETCTTYFKLLFLAYYHLIIYLTVKIISQIFGFFSTCFKFLFVVVFWFGT
jgi:hypothetical protein